jgi:hypothetical protein
MWQMALWAAAIATGLAGASSIAATQGALLSGPRNHHTAGLGPRAPSARAAADNAATADRPGEDGNQAPGASPPLGYGTPAAGSGRPLPPCSSSPPYISVPCMPPKR